MCWLPLALCGLLVWRLERAVPDDAAVAFVDLGHETSSVCVVRNRRVEAVRTLDPEAIADAYWHLHCQPRSAWTHELDLRPWIEKF